MGTILHKLILAALVGVLVSGPVFADEQGNYCGQFASLYAGANEIAEASIKKCAPGDILVVKFDPKGYGSPSYVAAQFCRYDRQILIHKAPKQPYLLQISCVYLGRSR